MKPTLLLLHGALCTSAQFELLSERLMPYFDVHTFDFSAHDQTPYHGVLNMRILVRDIEQYTKKLECQNCHIFGYSMGGYAAVSFAMNHPDRVGNIMTLGTKWDWNPESSAKEVSMLDPKVIAEKVPSYANRLQSMFGEKNWTNVVEKTAGLMLDLGSGAALEKDDFSKIVNNVLICRGSEDKMVSAKSSKEVACWLMNGTYQELEEIPHPLEKVDLDVLVMEIVRFCA